MALMSFQKMPLSTPAGLSAPVLKLMLFSSSQFSELEVVPIVMWTESPTLKVSVGVVPRSFPRPIIKSSAALLSIPKCHDAPPEMPRP